MKFNLLVEEPYEFDFRSLKKDNDIQTITGIPVKIDKVMYDLCGETALAVSGTLVIKGVKLRGVWDTMGNPMDFKKIISLRNAFIDLRDMFSGYDSQYFKLVKVKEIDC